MPMGRRSLTDTANNDAKRRAALLTALKSLPTAPFWRTKEALLAACAAGMESTPTADDLTVLLQIDRNLIGAMADVNEHGLYYQIHSGQRLYCRSDVHPRDFTGITLAACASLANNMATAEVHVRDAIEHSRSKHFALSNLRGFESPNRRRRAGRRSRTRRQPRRLIARTRRCRRACCRRLRATRRRGR